MKWLFRFYGALMESLKGPGDTQMLSGESRHQTASVTFERTTLLFEITSHRIIYLTTYHRRWIPAMKRAIFEVEGRVVSGDSEEVNPLLLERVVFPNLSSRGLLHTEYPHIRAISAYLDRVSERIGSSVVLV